MNFFANTTRWFSRLKWYQAFLLREMSKLSVRLVFFLSICGTKLDELAQELCEILPQARDISMACQLSDPLIRHESDAAHNKTFIGLT
jgi:hypothetical protein